MKRFYDYCTGEVNNYLNALLRGVEVETPDVRGTIEYFTLKTSQVSVKTKRGLSHYPLSDSRIKIIGEPPALPTLK